MPIEVGLWKVNDKIEKMEYQMIESENKLEEILVKDLSILDDKLLPIGRQIATDYGKYLDMLAINDDGDVVIIELKRNRTSREAVSQTLDYASWVQDLTFDRIKEIYKENNNGETLEQAYEDKLEEVLPEEINGHKMTIVCAELDSETERIINYLADNYDVPINAVFFRYFKMDNNEFLSRSWLKDPKRIEAKTAKSTKKQQETWNGRDFVVNFDDGPNRNWEDAVKFGFVSAGNGLWYTRTLKQLEKGNRIFCMIPKQGYVGIGEVVEEVQPIKDIMVEVDGVSKRLIDCDLKESNLLHDKDNLENCEFKIQPSNYEINIRLIEWKKNYRKKIGEMLVKIIDVKDLRLRKIKNVHEGNLREFDNHYEYCLVDDYEMIYDKFQLDSIQMDDIFISILEYYGQFGLVSIQFPKIYAVHEIVDWIDEHVIGFNTQDNE